MRCVATRRTAQALLIHIAILYYLCYIRAISTRYTVALTVASVALVRTECRQTDTANDYDGEREAMRSATVVMLCGM